MYAVRIIDAKTKKPVKWFAPKASERAAEKLERGVNINLNHIDFYTDIEFVPPGSRNGA